MRRTPMARSPFKRKNEVTSTSANTPKNIHSKTAQSHAQQAPVAIISIVKMLTTNAHPAPPPASAFRGSIPKSQPVRSEAYRRLVAALPCVICGIAGQSQAAHGSAGKGMGIKACDTTLFPACAARPGIAGCHAQLDQGAMFSKAVRHQLEPAWAADTQRRIHAMGKWPKGIPCPHDDETGSSAYGASADSYKFRSEDLRNILPFCRVTRVNQC